MYFKFKWYKTNRLKMNKDRFLNFFHWLKGYGLKCFENRNSQGVKRKQFYLPSLGVKSAREHRRFRMNNDRQIHK